VAWLKTAGKIKPVDAGIDRKQSGWSLALSIFPAAQGIAYGVGRLQAQVFSSSVRFRL
jgi:hypothetical protein